MRKLYKLATVLILLVLAMSAFPVAGTNSVHASACDWAQFVADVTIPDGTNFQPGATFTKTWRLRNIGQCTWTTSYALVFDSGNQFGAPTAVNFPTNVPPGATVDLTVDMTAPSNPGHYRSYWKLRNASGVIFGIGYSARGAFWAEIKVAGATGTAYDFTANAASAVWTSGAGTLPFPGTEGDAKGFALTKTNLKFESGVEAAQPGLLFGPHSVYNGFIQGIYPAFRVQSGDRFQTTVGCEYGATACYVAFRLDYQIGNGPVRTFWQFRERYEGLTYSANLDLRSLAGQDVKFILFMSAYGSAAGDRAIMGHPIIARSGASMPTATPTVTGTPPTVTPSKTPGPETPTVPPSSCDKVRFVRDVNYPDGTTLAAGTQFNKTWQLQNVGSCTWTTSYQLVFYSGDQMGGPAALTFPQQVKPGDTVNITVSLTAPSAAGSYRGYWMFKNDKGALFGIGSLANKPWWVDIRVTGSSGPTPTATSTSKTPTPTYTPTATATTSSTGNWTTYRNSTYGFTFKFPPTSVVNTYIYLPIEPGTNLSEKYIEINTAQFTGQCASPNPGGMTSENVTINGIEFFKETGNDAATGNRYDWVAYSAPVQSDTDICMSMSFILHSTDPGNYTTPPPLFDEEAESAVFDTIMDTFAW